MATYAVDKYGAATTYYGSPPGAGASFGVDNFLAQEGGYGIVNLSWSPPKSTITWSRLRIIRSSAGFPVSESDGTLVAEVLSTSPTQKAVDRGLTPARFYYYSLFLETDLPTFSSTTTYTRGQVVKDVSGNGYVSIKTGNVGALLTDVTAWSPINIVKRWMRGADAALLATKRYDSTTALYSGLPRAYRSDDPDWVEPVQPVSPDANYYAAWPALGRFTSIFGFQLDAVRTRYESLLRITDPNYTAASNLPAMAAHMGVDIEPSVSARIQRLRLKNAPLLASKRGTKDALVSAINATLNWDAVVTDGKNLMLSEDVANAGGTGWPVWDASLRYTVGDRVTFSGYVFEALVTAVGAAQTPNTSGDNTWWKRLITTDDTNLLYRSHTASVAGWVPDDRTKGKITAIVGARTPGLTNNAFAVSNISGAAATITFPSVGNYWTPAWSGATTYKKGDLVSSGAKVWIARVDSPVGTPGAAYLAWGPFLDAIPAVMDPARVFKDAIPVKAADVWTLSANMMTINAAAGNQASLMVDWYTSAGVFISTYDGTNTSVGTVSMVRVSTAVVVPATAAYAAPRLRFPSLPTGANGRIQVQDIQFEKSASATTYEAPRQVKVLVKPDRVNLVTNSSFEVDTAGWVTGARWTTTRSTAQAFAGTTSLLCTRNSGFSGSGTVSYNLLVVAGKTYTASFYVYGGVGNYSIEFTGTPSGSKAKTFAAPGPTWTRQSLSFTASASGTVGLYFTDNPGPVTNGATVYLDAVILEEGSLNAYVDPSQAISTDYFWAGTAHASKSFYYQGYQQKRYRLDDLIKGFVPLGASWSTTYNDV